MMAKNEVEEWRMLRRRNRTITLSSNLFIFEVDLYFSFLSVSGIFPVAFVCFCSICRSDKSVDIKDGRKRSQTAATLSGSGPRCSCWVI